LRIASDSFGGRGEIMADELLPSELERLQLSPRDIERRKAFIDFQSDDVARIATIKELVVRNADRYASMFFDHLATAEEASGLIRNRGLLEQARRLKHEHLIAMVQGDYGRDYMEQRVRLGVLYSRAGLDARVFLGAFHLLMRAIGADILKQYADAPGAGFDCFMSVMKIGFLDIGLIVDVLIAERERTIKLQQHAIRELSTPVLQLRDRLLVLPMIGVIDSMRAKQLTDDLLLAIRSKRAKIVVMDVTGVAAVDSKVANHLIQTVAAARLMGANVIVTGISADVAQSLVALGVDLTSIKTMNDLQGGLEEAERLLGYKVAQAEVAAPAFGSRLNRA
jgi:rsbT co-antagonist protein RsbR